MNNDVEISKKIAEEMSKENEQHQISFDEEDAVYLENVILTEQLAQSRILAKKNTLINHLVEKYTVDREKFDINIDAQNGVMTLKEKQ